MTKPDVLGHVGANVKRLRDEMDLSQQALADAAGVSRRMIAGLETGETNISLAKLSLLASVLGVDFSTIVSPPDDQLRDGGVVTWRGRYVESRATLHCSARASAQVELWTWVLAPGERYDAEPDPDGWSELLYVVRGELTLELPEGPKVLKVGSSLAFASSVQYAYANRHTTELMFLRNVVS